MHHVLTPTGRLPPVRSFTLKRMHLCAIHVCFIRVIIVIIMIQEGTGSVRFVSVPDFSKIHRFGSVRFGNVFLPIRRGSACVFWTSWLGPVRFCSVPRLVPAGSGIKRFSSVRFGWFGSVSHSFLIYIYIYHIHFTELAGRVEYGTMILSAFGRSY